jgi:hypothetical protein
MSAGDTSSSGSASKDMASAQASEKYKFGTTNSIVNATKKVQFGATNTIGNPATAISAQPGNATVNQAANAFKAKISSRTRSGLEEISKKRMTHVVDDVLGVPAQNINGKLIASVVQHLCEQYDGDVRERVYNEYEPTVSCWKTVTESSLRAELKDTIKQEMLSKCRTEGTIEYNEIADEVRAERDALKASLRAEECEKIRKELDEERPAMKAAMKAEKEQDIKRELRAEMGPSVRKDLTEKFIKRLTEGVDTEPIDNTANIQPPVAKQAQAAPTRPMSINDMLNTQEIQPRSALAHAVPMQLAPLNFAENQSTPLEPPQALAQAAPMQSAAVLLPSIETAYPPAAADQSTNIQSATAPFSRGLSAYSSKGTSSRASSLASTSTGSKRSSEEFQEDDEGDSNKRARYSLLQGFDEVWHSTISEHLGDYRVLPRISSPADSVLDMPTCKRVRFDRFQSLPAKLVDEDDDRSTSENDDDAVLGYTVDLQGDASLVNDEPTAEHIASLLQDDDPYENFSGGVASYGATGLIHNDNDSQQGSAFDGYGEESVDVEYDDEDTTLVEPSASAPFETKIKTEDEDEDNKWLAELDSEL